MAAKLASYEWNLAQPFWCTFHVHEVSPDTVTTSVFRGGTGYQCQHGGQTPRLDQAIYENLWLRVEAEVCNHGIDSLIYKITERQSFAVDERKIEALGLVKGNWLRLLKKHFHDQIADGTPLTVIKIDQGITVSEPVDDAEHLYQAIRKEQPPVSVGYLTDVGFSAGNLAKIEQVMAGVTLLVCECSFGAEEADKARNSHHLCTTDLNLLMERLRPEFVLPMHLSKSYLRRSRAIYDQLQVPSGVKVIPIPDRLTPRPLLRNEVSQVRW